MKIASIVLIAVLTGSAYAAEAPTVEVRGLRVVGPAYGDDMQGLRAFNWSEGTAIALLVQVPGGGIIELDHDASTLDKLVDDQGTDLTQGEGWGQAGFEMMTSVSEDGAACLPTVTGLSAPAAGSRTISASGKIVLMCATTKQAFTQEDVAFVEGTTINAGAIPFTITKVGKPDWGDAPLQITLSTNQEVKHIESIRFLGADGNEIESSAAGSTSMRAFNNVKIDRDYNFKQKIDGAMIEITYWIDARNVEIPFDVTTSVGLR